MSRESEHAAWLILAYRLPAEPGRLKSAVWRRLNAAGAVYLANSVATLPAAPSAERLFRRLRSDISRAGGSAQLLLLWLLLSVLLIAVALILSHGTSRSASGCAEPWPAICADPASSHRPHPASTATSQPSAPTRQVIPGG